MKVKAGSEKAAVQNPAVLEETGQRVGSTTARVTAGSSTANRRPLRRATVPRRLCLLRQRQ